MRRKIVSLIVIIALVLSVASGLCAMPAAAAEVSGTTDWKTLAESGKGFTQNASYYIATAEDLGYFRDMINANDIYEVASGYCTFYLTEDIVLNPSDVFEYSIAGHIRGVKAGCSVTSWVPIGNHWDGLYNAKTFKGVFDGQGHTISGLYCNVTRNSDCTVAGLFGYVRGTVKNLNVTNAYVSNTQGSAGGIAMDTNGMSANITNCTFDGYVFGSTSGGISGTLEYGTIDGCVSNASVVGSTAGGIVGCIKNTTAVVRNCFSAGKVIGSAKSCDVGGIVGCAMPPSEIKNCGSTAELDGSTYGYGNVSGICGLLGASGGTCTMENCWFAGTIGVNCGWVAGAGVIQDTYKDYVSIQFCYTAYQSANYIFQTNTALQSSDQGAGGCGKFGAYDVQGRSTLTVTATENSGGTGYWADRDGDGQKEFCHVGDTTYVISGQTDLVSALNAWVADHNDDAGTLYRMWTLEEDGVPHFASGEWSDRCAAYLTESDGVVVIRTPEELARLAAEVNIGNNFSGKTIRLDADIDLSGRYWTPIGTASTPFAGIFDGAGHTVSGMAVRGSGNYHGLFGYVTGALRGLRLERAAVQGGSSCGGIVGYSAGEIDSCTFSGAVFGTSGTGGIAGAAAGQILNSRNAGIVSGTNLAGGIAGSCTGTVGNCFSSGKVTAAAAASVASMSLMSVEMQLSAARESVDLSTYQGNLVGSAGASVDNSYDASAVTDPSDIPALQSALAAAAAENEQYTGWTYAAGVNDGLPYYACFAGGSGTAEEPYLIADMEQLTYLATLVNGGADQSGTHFRMNADLVLNDGYFQISGTGEALWLNDGGTPHIGGQLARWIPIGSEEHPFAGVFDGGGHMISGLYCEVSGGLFGRLSGTVKNLMICKSYFSAGENAVAGSGGTVINCGSNNVGGAGALTGINCWDAASMPPSAAQLNAWIAGNAGYSRWYATPGSALPSFVPSYIDIAYVLNGGSQADLAERYIYGETLPTLNQPERVGYDFAGWSAYVNGGAAPAAAYFKSGTLAELSEATSLMLIAAWAEQGKTLFDYCTLTGGVYVLNSDVVLAGDTVVPGDMILDLNGHSIGGYAERALLWKEGGSLTLRNSGSAATIQTGSRAIGGCGGQVILPGTYTNMTAAALDVPVEAAAGAYTLAAFSAEMNGPALAFLAKYSAEERLVSVSAVPCSGREVFLELAGSELSANRVRCFVIPTGWLN